MTTDIGREFMEKTKYKYLSQSDQMMRVPDPPLEIEYDHTAVSIDLPKPDTFSMPAFDLRQAIEQRRSIRKYSPDKLSLEELSYMLWTTQGVQSVFQGRVTIRTVPSAGARHAFETLLLINNVEDVSPGLYRYGALDHKLVLLSQDPNLADNINIACHKQKFILASAVTFFWVAVPYRMMWRYSERSYRYLHLDAGHVCQNLYLVAEQLNCGVCAIAAFDDDALNSVFGLDGEEMFVIYLATLGRKEQSPS